MKLVFLIFLGIFHSISAFELVDPSQDGVEWAANPSGQSQTIYIDENNDGYRVRVAFVTDVLGALSITVSTNDILRSMIDLQTEPEGVDGTKFYLSVNRLDYEALVEAPLPTIISVDIYDNDDPSLGNRKILNLNIKNLDDEIPTLSVSACLMDEETDIDVTTSTCIFQISDRDGWLNEMDFSGIIGTKGEPDLFELKYAIEPNDTARSADVSLVLKSGRRLDYETTTLYTFHIEAKDRSGTATVPPSVPVIVQVQDISDTPPRWDSGFKSAININEKTAMTIEVSATDGDIQINHDIKYECQDASGFVHIHDETIGSISVDAIDRDASGLNQITFVVKAIEIGQEDQFLEGSITLLVEDIDDNVAALTVAGYVDPLEIDEGATDLGLEISASDIDLGENAMYDVKLQVPPGSVDFTSAISVIPNKGYEDTSLSLTILDPSQLDYENEEWRTFTMELWTFGTKNKSMTDSFVITVKLNDLNDEVPEFDETEYFAEIKETVPIGSPVTTIKATDKDKEDQDKGLKHELIGTQANNILEIEELGGAITTKIDKAFDFEKQSEVIVQIKATDANDQWKSAQLTITVLDVNDEKPRIVVGATLMTVLENQKTGFVIPSDITASDDDSKPYLEFTIDWAQSYATKSSQRVPDDVFEKFHCIKVNTLRDDADNGTVTAELTIVETEVDNTPDFEVFDNLYIQLVVKDSLNEVAGMESDTTRIVINIQNDNDNPPRFPDDTSTVKRSVIENADDGTVITYPVATDDDGNTLTYSIQSTDPETTPNWVTIDSKTGEITVRVPEGQKLDCDDPVRDSLFYNVTASDDKYETTVTITVDINDQNDNAPTMDDSTITIPELENDDVSSNGVSVLKLDPKDKDRSEPFSTVYCAFAVTTDREVTRRFSVNNNEIFIQLEAGVNLDRDEGSPQYNFELNCYDDPSQQGSSVSNPINPPPKITIILEDINDNDPTISNTNIQGMLNENSPKGTEVTLEGSDKDEGDNARIKFLEIKDIQRINEEDPNADGTVNKDLFTITTDDDGIHGVLTLNADNLRGYYGSLVLTISLTDLGTPPRSQDVEVTIEVTKYNFAPPKFIFPAADTQTQYLQPEQAVNSQLILFDGNNVLPTIIATDQQDDKFGVKFALIDTGDGALDIFTLYTNVKSQAQLRLKTTTFPQDPYSLTIMATIDAPANTPGNSFTQNATLKIDFFNEKTTDPVFSEHNETVQLEEEVNGLTHQIEAAAYTKTDLPDLPIYYLLPEGDTTIFSVNITTGLITLLKKLDYEDVKTHNLVIQSSNSRNIKPEASNLTKLSLTIEVQDVNDNAPVFDEDSYIGTLVLITSGTTNTRVLQVTATDVDTTSQTLRYSITQASGSTDALNQISTPFEMDSEGWITRNFQSSGDWNGYFTLEVTVHDESDADDHKGVAQVQIFLVTDQHLVQFTFENTREDVIDSKEEIKAILDEAFKDYSYNATVVDPVAGNSEDTETTISQIYFVDIKSEAPVDKTEIYKRVTDLSFFGKLKQAFMAQGLALQNFDSSTTAADNLEATLKAWLIGVSVVLGSLCLILLIAFVLKTRALNQRIDKLSNTKFGSQESGLNRTGVAAPTTNKHAVEGSNPVYNNDVDTKDIDRRISVTSGDSDLIGVEDDEKFNYDSPTKEYMIE